MCRRSQNKPPKLIKTKWGFYQYKPPPSDHELREYYAKKYYQEGHGSFETSYCDEEIEWFRLKSRLIYHKANLILPDGRKSFLDVGCGEGWLSNEFYEHGHTVHALDFSRAGIDKYHSHLLPFFKEGNVYELLDGIVLEGESFDIIALCNVIEHVTKPVKLLKDLKNLMYSGSLLVITAPNDFSPLHEHLIKAGIVSKKWWLFFPDHLSYFNKESMCSLLDDLGFEVKGVIADNPIDLNLLNDNSNYINDNDKGKNTHMFRVRADNFLASIDFNKHLHLYEILGSMGVGRDLTYYCSLKK